MVKFKPKYHNILFLFFICMGNLKAGKAPISISIRTQEGKRTDKIFAGKPFRLVIDFKDKGAKYFDKVDFVNKGSCAILDKTIITRLGGRSEKSQYVFMLRCDEVGPLTLGPIRFEGKRDAISTGIFTIDVREPDSRVDEKSPTFLKIEASETDIYVGQRIPITASFYSRSQMTHDFSLIAPSSTETLKFIGMAGPIKIREKRGSDLYKVARWRVDVTPQKSGTIVMPSMYGLYLEGWLLSLFQGQLSAYSNALVFNVKPIPKFDGILDAVGSFTSFFVEVDKTHVEVGQAIALKFVLTGETDFSALSSLRLNVPEGFKFFESAKDLTFSGGQETKIFEYVIQPQKEGEFIIPLQEFVFFDPNTKSFKKIQTRPITISVTPASPVLDLDLDQEQEDVKQKLDASMFKKYSGDGKSKPALPNWLVVLLAVGALFWGVWPWTAKMIQNFVIKPRRIKNAFVVVQNEFNDIYKVKQANKLYPLFINLFSLRLGVSYNFLSESIIYNALSKAGMPDESLKKWQKFYKLIEQCYYSSEFKVDDNLFIDGQVWINELKKYI